mmetsp:Transcript_2984/g.5869  ORF Transcript_2984/g.5869 Transcript_2984/m.5869 type:complete len:221 (+) Transcript_2984:1822-2484(+)
MTSSFSSLTYKGSLYLQKKCRMCLSSRCFSFCTMREMLRSATYCSSGLSPERMVIRGFGIFSRKTYVRMLLFSTTSRYLMMTFTADIATAELAWMSRGTTRSITVSACLAVGLYLARQSRIEICPHSVHSFMAESNLFSMSGVILKTSFEVDSAISASAATALATTIALWSEISDLRVFRNPCSSTESGDISNSFATHTAAVFLTYGSGSLSPFASGVQK